MNIPTNILSIIDIINKSEDRWKATYMSFWGYASLIKSQFENTSDWDKEIKLWLPASKNRHHIYTYKQLHSILTSKDLEITLNYLQTLFSLFEELLNEASKILCSSELNTSKWIYMEEFFKENNTNDILTSPQLKELKLAKETRNCYIHKGSKINKKWLNAYKEAKGNPIASINQNLMKGFGGFKKLFHQIEEWQDLIIEISNKIKNKIE